MVRMSFIVPKQFLLSVPIRSFGISHQINRFLNSATALLQQKPFMVNAEELITELPTSIKKIGTSFQTIEVPDPMARFKQLLVFPSKLDPLPLEFHNEKHRIQGCVSQGWIMDSLLNGIVQFRADSDSKLTKGTAARLVQGLSGWSLQEILVIQTDFIEKLGLKQSLTPSRNNGFLNMFKLMQRKTLELSAVDLRSQDSHRGSPSDDGGTGTRDGPPSETPVEDSIREKIIEGLNPEQLLIINESSKHAGHMGNPNNDPETHFKLEIVASKFEGVISIKRHRMVYALLQEELAGPVHALALNTRAPTETK